MKKNLIIVFVLILATIFNWFIACKKSNTANKATHITVTTPKDLVDSIAGIYVGIVHYTYSFSSTRYPSDDSDFDTTYSFNFIVSKVSQDSSFTTNTSYTTCVFMGITNSGYFAYDSSNVYEVLYFPCADTHGAGWGTMEFFPTSDSVWYNGSSLDEEGGGQVFSLICRETFSGKKL